MSDTCWDQLLGDSDLVGLLLAALLGAVLSLGLALPGFAAPAEPADPITSGMSSFLQSLSKSCVPRRNKSLLSLVILAKSLLEYPAEEKAYMSPNHQASVCFSFSSRGILASISIGMYFLYRSPVVFLTTSGVPG